MSTQEKRSKNKKHFYDDTLHCFRLRELNETGQKLFTVGVKSAGIVESRGEWTCDASCFDCPRLHDQVIFLQTLHFAPCKSVTATANPVPPFVVFRFADAAIEASDGTVYFSDASTRFSFDNWFLDFFEYRFTGRLLKYDPRTGEASVVLDGLGFANGVALPPDEACVVVCESMR